MDPIRGNMCRFADEAAGGTGTALIMSGGIIQGGQRPAPGHMALSYRQSTRVFVGLLMLAGFLFFVVMCLCFLALAF